MNAGPIILALNYNPRNLDLLEQFLGKAGYQTAKAATLEEFDEALRQTPSMALALLDLAGFDSRIWERCDSLRKAGVPFLVISPRPNPSVRQSSLKRGAKGLLTKPLSSKALLEMIRNLLDQ